MKKVIIVRHAKSVPYGYDDDFHRDLTERGVSDALKISQELKNRIVFPDLIIASPATRTMHTALVFCGNLDYSTSSIRQVDDLYEGMTTQSFIDLLQQLPENVQTVFVFGHNPTVYYLVYNLVKYFNSDMPTCSTVGLDFEIDSWKEVSAHGGKITFQLVPKKM